MGKDASDPHPPNEKTPAVLRRGSYGGAKRSRTADLLNAIQALYQLSYSPEKIGWFRVVPLVGGR